MFRWPLIRLMVVGVLVTVLVSLFVLHGASWALDDPDQRAGVIDETTVSATVVDDDPVTLELETGEVHTVEEFDGERVEPGEEIEVQLTAQEVGANTAVIETDIWETSFMHAVSAVAVILVFGRVVDTWRFNVGEIRLEPRQQPLRRQVNRRLRRRQTESAAEDEGRG